MKQIIPFDDVKQALDTLDNGGRFFNIFTKAGDGSITAAELHRVAGVLAKDQKLQQYLALALAKLTEEEKELVTGCFTEDLKSRLDGTPEALNLQQPVSERHKGLSCILTGNAEYMGTNKSFEGFIFITVMAGNVTTLVPVPISEQYNLYRLKTESGEVVIANEKSAGHLPEQDITITATVKAFSKSDCCEKELKYYLEVSYYSLLQ